MSTEAIGYARAKNEQALAMILECEKSGKFTPFNLDGPQTVELGDLY
jgi:hypothetical protein